MLSHIALFYVHKTHPANSSCKYNIHSFGIFAAFTVVTVTTMTDNNKQRYLMATFSTFQLEYFYLRSEHAEAGFTWNTNFLIASPT